MLDLFASEYRTVLQDILAWSVCLAALYWGSGPERIVAATWLALFEIAAKIYRSVLSEGYRLHDVDVFLATTDVLAGAIWITVALYANRSYTFWIAGLQLLAVLAHLARGAAEMTSPIGYATMVIAPGWFQLVFLGFGLVLHFRRKKRFGAYRDWRSPQNPTELRVSQAIGIWKSRLRRTIESLLGTSS